MQIPAGGLVQWHRWGTELAEVARQAGKPLYIFAGSRLNELARATVRQSFASPETAEFLNRHFVCVWVDLDEQVHLGAVIRVHLSLLRQSEALPVHLWLSPELRVLEVAAYLPPTEEWGKLGFLKVAQQVNEGWGGDPSNLGAKFTETLEQAAEAAGQEVLPVTDAGALRELLDQAAAEWRGQADALNGGFGEAPKQLQPELLRFLLTRAGPEREHARFTLLSVANSALRDPLDGGFFKYSTDGAWRLPSLQKRLADQARMALAYLDADALAPDPVLRAAARGALDYTLTRLALPAGGFAFAEDGTEEPTPPAYLWSAEELGAVLGPDAAAFCQRHRVLPAGNLSEDLDPGARLKGLNILVSSLPSTSGETVQLAKVAALRQSRRAPVRDERAFVGPQALLLAALVRAAGQLEEPRYRQAADRLWLELQTYQTAGESPSVQRMAGASEQASPADLAALAFGARTYAQVTGRSEPARLADQLLRKLVTEYLDARRGCFMVRPLRPATGFLAYPAPAPAEPCHPEALALLAGLGGEDAALLRSGMAERLRRAEASNPGELLLALGNVAVE
ncbi:MAG: thioredoxin domain-containing protein [Opitutaceae bacterium]|nr:thioredoxin domain-containing protein [Opitutaceae bacterium]